MYNIPRSSLANLCTASPNVHRVDSTDETLVNPKDMTAEGKDIPTYNPTPCLDIHAAPAVCPSQRVPTSLRRPSPIYLAASPDPRAATGSLPSPRRSTLLEFQPCCCLRRPLQLCLARPGLREPPAITFHLSCSTRTASSPVPNTLCRRESSKGSLKLVGVCLLLVAGWWRAGCHKLLCVEGGSGSGGTRRLVGNNASLLCHQSTRVEKLPYW
jgi:hypothetical protein